jgi:gliding motility-associated-like protein
MTNIKNPVAIPDANTTYKVIASVGTCNATDDINIKVVPYPKVDAGRSSGICLGSSLQLNAFVTGDVFTWSPVSGLDNPNSLTPIANPTNTTVYTLTTSNAEGCVKPVSDTVEIKVISVHASAGNDTVIVINQPLQLGASGGTNYTWSPSTGMNDANIPNPVIVLGPAFDSIVYMVRVSTPEGCFADDSLKIKIFKTLPEIFIPSAFTPNNDGLNDVLKPVIAGMKHLEYFTIYNRWGQMLFSTSEIGKGWDGTLNGIKQQPGTYVFVAKAIDYLGGAVIKKGTVVLIR